MEHNRNNEKIKLSSQLTLAITKLRQLPNDSPCACKSNMQKLLLLNEVTHWSYHIHSELICRFSFGFKF